MKAAMVRGAVAMLVWSGSALAQQPNAGSFAPPGGVGGGTVGAEAPPPPPAAGSAPVAPGGEAAPPVESTPPPAPPQPAPAPPPQVAPDDQDDYEPRRRRRRKPLDWQPDDEEETSGAGWTLRGPHFILSAERMAGVLGHTYTIQQKTEVIDPFTGVPTGAVTTRELKHTGTDVAFLGSGAATFNPGIINPFIIPRVAFDGMLANGLTLGGSISYFVASGEAEEPDSVSGATMKEETPTLSVFLFAPRLGVIIQASPKIAVWLRGGVTRISATTERERTDFDTGQTITASATTTMVDVTLDPQLVLSPVPHVGVLLGAAIDVGVSGTLEETSGSIKEEDGFTASSYGVTAGLAAIF